MGDTNLVNALIRTSADLEIQDEYEMDVLNNRNGCTPLIVAAEQGHLESVVALINANADIYASNG